MKKSTQGLVIRQNKTGETDRVITILTPEGVLTAYARGSLKPGGKLTSSTAMLGYSEFELAEGKSMYTVTEAQSIMRFARLSANMTRYSLACYFCELARLLAPADEGSAEFLSLTLNALYLLSETDKPCAEIKLAYELRAMSEAGYRPDVEGCCACADDTAQDVFFDSAEGNILCRQCAEKSGRRANCPQGALAAMRYILNAPLSKAFSFKLGGRSLAALERISEEYVRRWIEHPIQTLEFYKQLL